MKLISLNVWGGKLLQPLLEYIQEESKDTDIFCFQEVVDSKISQEEEREEKHRLLDIFKTNLPEFNFYFSPAQDGFDGKKNTSKHVSFGLAIYIKKNFVIDSFDSVFIYGEKNGMIGNDIKTLPYNAQFLTFFDLNNKKITIANVHGISEWPKTDTPFRIKQSEIINEFLKKQNNLEIICGDFNLFPNTKSLALIEEKRRNLIKDFQIKTTRTENIPDPHVSDYIFLSPEITIKSFSVPYVLVSDHLPLVLEFE